MKKDLAIAGGGLVGLSLGLACAEAGLEVVVVDREDPMRMRAEPYDGRTSAIAAGSKRVLEGIGLWPLVADHAEPILEIRVADNSAPLFLHYDHRDLGSLPLGYIVENRILREALFERARALRHLTLLAPMEVAGMEGGAHGATLRLSDGREIRAPLVAAADGRHSPLRRAAGIEVMEWSYSQHAITCTVHHEKPHHGIAVEHFLAPGPFAILPMTSDPVVGHRSSIVWTERASLVPALMALEPGPFTHELQRRFGDYLGAIAVVGGRWSYPLALMHAHRYAAPRLVLLGEAAHVIHPLAGQGLNLGIRDVAILAELLADACRLGLDPGTPDILARYERRRRFDNVTLAAVTDGLNRLFSNDSAPLTMLRDLGLAAVNRLPPVKRLLMEHAMGALGTLPRLAQGKKL
ncbi:MAG TPA: UbiH/UbiF/VisC/COQ6 family ubiquinone biosynthesis hydroxylase [Stellaceae bacterium]|nr:UbiH/UbiF/VisC/COQ6 family ubiquinone biosynthesis hydroxylase [Stellaceae bacterium]